MKDYLNDKDIYMNPVSGSVDTGENWTCDFLSSAEYEEMDRDEAWQAWGGDTLVCITEQAQRYQLLQKFLYACEQFQCGLGKQCYYHAVMIGDKIFSIEDMIKELMKGDVFEYEDIEFWHHNLCFFDDCEKGIFYDCPDVECANCFEEEYIIIQGEWEGDTFLPPKH